MQYVPKVANIKGARVDIADAMVDNYSVDSSMISCCYCFGVRVVELFMRLNFIVDASGYKPMEDIQPF